MSGGRKIANEICMWWSDLHKSMAPKVPTLDMLHNRIESALAEAALRAETPTREWEHERRELEEFRRNLKLLIVESLKVNVKRLNLDYGEGIWLELDTPLNYAEGMLKVARGWYEQAGESGDASAARWLERRHSVCGERFA